MDKIYIEGELPKCCLMCTLECPEEQRCVDGFTRDCENCDVSDRPKTCPLKPLSEILAEERNRVMQKVLDIIDNKFNDYGWVEEKFKDIKKYVLDQIERGEL